MPNTLIHIAIQTPLSRAVSPRTEIPWILAGVAIPDIPWIFQRLWLAAGLADPYQIRLYFTVQASLLYCLFLSLAVALFSRKPGRIFPLLAANCLLHLLLDALQLKWGNGVLFLAPFDWQSTSIGLVWPENIMGYIISTIGLLYLCYKCKEIHREGLPLNTSPRFSLAALCLLFYLLTPFLFMGDLEKSNSNYVKILKNEEERLGQHVALDRIYYSKEKAKIYLFDGEPINVTGVLPESSTVMSLQGIFTSATSIQSTKFHKHNAYRDLASIIGLSFSLAIWLYVLLPKLGSILPIKRRL